MKKQRYNIIYILVLIGIALLSAVPILWALVLSLTPEYEMFKSTGSFLPGEMTFENYARLFQSGNSDSKIFYQAMINSINLAAYTIGVGLPLCTLSAYVLTKMEFGGKEAVKKVLIFTMAIPVFMTITPLYKIFASLRLLNNLFWISVIYVTAFLPLGTWLLSIHFESIPAEIEEAGRIDGASRLQIFFHLLLPLSRSMMFSVFLIVFIMAWNQFQIPLILASNAVSKPISVAVSEFVSKDSVRYGITAASGLLAMLPPVFLAVLFKKYIILGIAGKDMD
ncbi:carbohydrate ABC transporter permease [Filifactor villosus]|uniref:Carbohydrate ABC transporter permease n=1 Tax=Filifactor villosus TaxID=29374 RepID=A0ABV9QM52_9FIRM